MSKTKARIAGLRCKANRRINHSVLNATFAMHVPVFQLLRSGFAHLDNFDLEHQSFARHRMIHVKVDDRHAHFVHHGGSLAFAGRHQHDVPDTRHLALEVFLRHALNEAFAVFAVGLFWRNGDIKGVALNSTGQGFMQTRDHAALGVKETQWLTFTRAFDATARLIGDGVMQADHTLFIDIHGNFQSCDGQRGQIERRRIPACGNNVTFDAVLQRGETNFMWRELTFPCPSLWLLIAAVLLSACAGGSRRMEALPASETVSMSHAPRFTSLSANEAMFLALSLVGTPYRYGGNTPEAGFDCSGLIGYVFQHSLALALPRTTRALFQAAGDPVPWRDLRTGDLVFFGHRSTVSHAGIYVGESRFVHAPSSGGTVRLDHLDSAYWKPRFLGARRVLR